eukprot:291392-Pelagomonas_calceolata.AAC.5
MEGAERVCVCMCVCVRAHACVVSGLATDMHHAARPWKTVRQEMCMRTKNSHMLTSSFMISMIARCVLRSSLSSLPAMEGSSHASKAKKGKEGLQDCTCAPHPCLIRPEVQYH